MKPVRWMFAIWLVIALGATGCRKSTAEAAGESDVNGYFCAKCKGKFYTEQQVFAEHCPSCKDFNLRPVVGYVCDKDQQVTVAPRGGGAGRCEKCGAMLTALKLPREPELRAWGAVKKAKEEVCGN
jgi:hypothetical protein